MRSVAHAVRSLTGVAATHPIRACLGALLRSRDGSGLAETAICLPVLMTVITGIFTFGIAMNNYLLLTDATNVGARQLAISRGQTTDPCKTASAAVIAAAPILKSSSLTFSYVFNGTAYTGTTCSSSSPTTGAAGNLVQASTAKLTVTYPCTLKVYGTDFAPSCIMSAQTAELVQ